MSTPSVRNSNRKSLGSSNLIDFEEVGKFMVGDKKIKDMANAVFQVDCCSEHDIFITSQLMGIITIFKLSTLERIGILNKLSEMSIPKNVLNI